MDDGSMKLYFESSCAVDECARVCPISVIEPLSRPRHTLAALPHSSPLYRPTFRGRTAASQADALPVTKGVICRPRPPNPSSFPSALNARIILSRGMPLPQGYRHGLWRLLSGSGESTGRNSRHALVGHMHGNNL